MLDQQVIFDETGIQGGDYLNAGGVTCKTACYAAHPFNTKKQQECLKGCSDLKISEKEQKAAIKSGATQAKNDYGPAAATSTKDVPSAPAPQGGGLSTGAMIGIGAAALVTVGLVIYMVARKTS